MSSPAQNRSVRPVSAASALLGMIVVAVVAGVMVTVAVAPAVALTGVSAGNGVALFQDLPSDLRITTLDQKSTLYAKSGGKNVAIASFFTQDRDVIAWKDVPTTVKDAAVAGEDVRFYQHGGVDPTGIARAIIADASGKSIQGASTITQQYVKNVCIQEAERLPAKQIKAAYTACTDPTPGRKLREMRLAIGLEKKYSKDRILLGYLNIAGFGGQVYGIEAASEYYYGEHAKDLSAAKAASLIAIVNNPQVLRLDKKANLPANTARRNYILASELKQGMITQSVYDAAVQSKEKTKLKQPKVGCSSAGISGYFCSYVVDTILQSKTFGKTEPQRLAKLQESGWKIYSTLNLDLEKQAQKVLKTYVPSKTPGLKLGGASVSVQVGTGRIVSMVQNTKYAYSSKAGNTVVNYGTDSKYGDSGGFHPGSSYKLFTLLDWLKTGHTLNQKVNVNPRTIPDTDFQQCGKTYVGPPWTFGNDENEHGSYSILDATAASINGGFASMAEQLDLCDIRDMAKAFDVHTASGSALQPIPSSIIGTADNISPLTMTTAYAGMGAEGHTCTAIAIDSITAPGGKSVPVPKTKCRQSVDKQVAIAATDALHGVIQRGTASGDQTSDGIYEFGKTGTTDNAESTWFVGTTSKVATGVWIGNVSGHASLRQNYGAYCAVKGSTRLDYERHCVWRGIQTAVNAIYGGATTWPAPEQQYLTGGVATTPTTSTSVPNVVGQSEQSAISQIVAAGMSYVIGAPVASSQPAGTIAQQSPAAGSQAQGHVTVTINASSG